MGELRCPFCNSASDGPTALREHLLVCEDFTTVYGSPFGSVSIRDLESAMRESSRIIASVGWWYGKIRGLINKAKHAAPSPATPEAEGTNMEAILDAIDEVLEASVEHTCNREDFRRVLAPLLASPPAAPVRSSLPDELLNAPITWNPEDDSGPIHHAAAQPGIIEAQAFHDSFRAAAQEQKPVAWMIPKRLTIEGAIRHNVPKGWEGKVGWEPSLFGDANPVTDKDGVTHRPYPLFASPIPADGWVKCSDIFEAMEDADKRGGYWYEYLKGRVAMLSVAPGETK